MPDANFTDWKLERGNDGIYDLAIDEENRDLASTAGLETAIGCSIFSDRRAYPDEVADPWKRRGWIGDTMSQLPGDRYGSGVWLYEQSRGTSQVLAMLTSEVRTSVNWLKEEKLVKSLEPQWTFDPAKRRYVLTVLARDFRGGVSRHAFELWQATRQGRVGTNQ
jgi:phage gp46-like protein